MERKHLLNLTLIATFLTGCSGADIKPVSTETGASPTRTPMIETFTPTRTPFQPENFIPTISTETPIPIQTPERPIPYKMFGINFTDSGKKIDIKITLPNGNIYNIDSAPTVCETTSPYTSLFLPGEHVTCEYQFQRNPEDMAHFAHSGWFHKPDRNGGITYVKLEVEAIRHYLEDATEYQNDANRRLTLAQIRARMTEFLNANVDISQVDTSSDKLHVLAITRVPPNMFGPFDKNSGLTNEDIMPTLAAIDPTFAEFITDGKPQILVIFCGWHSPEEDNINTSGSGTWDWSRYAIVIGE